MFTIGADPEVFLQDKHRAFKSAHGIIVGTKRHPMKMGDHHFQVDGVALEYNIKPVTTEREFRAEIFKGRNMCGVIASPHYSVSERTSVFLDLSKHDKASLVVGCSSDINCFLEQENQREPDDYPWRHAGGHVHVGVPSCESFDDKMRLGRVLDKHLWEVGKQDLDVRRSESSYGQRGCVRMTDYGIEYRSLSSFWIHKAPLITQVYHAVQTGVIEYMKGLDFFVGEEKEVKYANS